LFCCTHTWSLDRKRKGEITGEVLFSSTQEGVCGREESECCLSMFSVFLRCSHGLLSYEELESLLKSNAKFLIWLFHSDLPSR